MSFVLGACATLGCHVNTAVLAGVLFVINTPAGPLGMLQIKLLTGTLLVTETVTTKFEPNCTWVSLTGLIFKRPLTWARAHTGKNKPNNKGNKKGRNEPACVIHPGKACPLRRPSVRHVEFIEDSSPT